jgi:hypothetical protein
MKYDDASWHSEGDFPDDLPPEAAATHAGMFLAWALLSGAGSGLHTDGSPAPIEKLRNRSVTPGAYYINECDGQFTGDELNNEGNAFAAEYYTLETGQFLRDYEEALGAELPTLYHIADSWQNFDKLKPVLDRRFQNWRIASSKQSNHVKSGTNMAFPAAVTNLEPSRASAKPSRASAQKWMWGAALSMVCAVLCLMGFTRIPFGVNLLVALPALLIGLFCMRKVVRIAEAEQQRRG